MSPIIARTTLILACFAGLSSMPRPATAAEGQISPFDSSRDSNVIVTVSDSPAWESDSRQETSEEHGLFEFETNLIESIPTALAEGIATQTSDITGSGIQAEATLSTAIQAEFGGAASTIAWNDFQSTFVVDSSTPYVLQGNLSASGGATCTFTFFGGAGSVEHTFTVTNDSVPLDISGTLPSGMYVLLAKLEGNLNLDGAEVGSEAATGSFSFEFLPCSAVAVQAASWGELKGVFR